MDDKIQELLEKIEALESKIDDLEGRIDDAETVANEAIDTAEGARSEAGDAYELANKNDSQIDDLLGEITYLQEDKASYDYVYDTINDSGELRDRFIELLDEAREMGIAKYIRKHGR